VVLRMNMKAIIAVVVVIGIGMLLMQTDSGRQYFGSGLDFIKARLSGLASGVFTGGGLFGQAMPGGLAFQMSLQAPAQTFYGQNYTVTNASLSVSGVCSSLMAIGGTVLHKDGAACSVELPYANGLVQLTDTGGMRFSGTAAAMTVDGTVYTTSDASGRVQTDFSVMPLSFTLDGMAQPLILLPATKGTLQRLAADGTVKSSEALDGESLQIAGFVGFLKLDSSNIVLQGSAVAIRGTGDHSSFVW